MRIGLDRFGQHRAIHVGVATGLLQQGAPKPVMTPTRSVLLIEHGRASQARKALDDQTQRFPGDVGIDGPEASLH